MTEQEAAETMARIKGNGMQYVSGLLFGAGMLTAVIIFKVLLHVNVCG